MSKPKIKTIFLIFGDDLNPEYISNELTILPTRTWKKNDPIEGRNVIRKESHWEISTEYEESYSVMDQLNQIYQQLHSKTREIKAILERTNSEAKFEIVIKIIDKETPALVLEKGIIDFASSLGASFDIDILI